ncbi:MAG: exodeoxyribonuclease VII large subunit [bacterium]
MSTPNFFDNQLPVFTVSQLNTFLNDVLGQMVVAVTGEVSDFKVVQNKWVTFDLKDATSRINCFGSLFEIGTRIQNGMEIKAVGKPGLYVPYGKFTFRLSSIEPIGEGALQRALELLKATLEKEGLFDPIHKKTLPRFSQSIGIITSRDAAAYTDILTILNSRWSGLDIYFGHVGVQGTTAPKEIATMIEWFNKQHPVDLLIISRGGGSLEDLQAFNNEIVVRSIFASRIPTITGIGHEKDTTLADLVADIAATTPTNAAEIAVPDQQEFLSELNRIANHFHSKTETLVNKTEKHLQHVAYRIESAVTIFEHAVETRNHKLLTAFETTQQTVQFHQKILNEKEKMLRALHPERLLQQGYSIIRDTTGRLLRNSQDIEKHATIIAYLAKGKITATIEETEP